MLLADLSTVKLLFDWVCNKKPDIQHGSCQMFYSLYYLTRPKMLGGNPERGRAILSKMISKAPYNLLARVTYMQFVHVKEGNEEEYRKMKIVLGKEFGEFNKQHEGFFRKKSYYEKYKNLNLLNATAFKRYSIILKYESDLF